MSKETLKRLGVPVFFLLVFLLPALLWDTLILQVSSELLRRSIEIGRYVIGTCLWLSMPSSIRRFPSAFSPGKNFFAIASLMIVTCCEVESSAPVNNRPLTRGIRMVSKYAGLTTRYSENRIGTSGRPSTLIPPPNPDRVSGAKLIYAARSTPRQHFERAPASAWRVDETHDDHVRPAPGHALRNGLDAPSLHRAATLTPQKGAELGARRAVFVHKEHARARVQNPAPSYAFDGSGNAPD